MWLEQQQTHDPHAYAQAHTDPLSFLPCTDPLPTVYCPSLNRLALDVQTWYRQQLEREPVRFMETAGLAALVTAVADVAGFVGAHWRDVVPVMNATTGVNAVLQSLKLQKGDLILMTNATYAAVSFCCWHQV